MKLSDIYTFNDTKTALHTPAYANVWTSAANFLQCTPPSGRSFSYALCYYSGPDAPTGNSDQNPSLPCTLSPDGTLANCTCYEISNDDLPPNIPYLVDIHAISNLDIYQETVEACGEQGTECLTSGRIPPVCEAINTNLLVPDADMISVYSERYKRNYVSKGEPTSTECIDKKDQGIYADCMTAPCYRTGLQDANGYDLVECKCPVYDGPFQIGQGGQSCNANAPPSSTPPQITTSRMIGATMSGRRRITPRVAPLYSPTFPAYPIHPEKVAALCLTREQTTNLILIGRSVKVFAVTMGQATRIIPMIPTFSWAIPAMRHCAQPWVSDREITGLIPKLNANY